MLVTGLELSKARDWQGCHPGVRHDNQMTYRYLTTLLSYTSCISYQVELVINQEV